jgi:GTP-binding protein
MQFIDEVRLTIKAGNGGNGMISFRHEKFVPKGGPDGGDGGRGGSVILRADKHLNTLLDFTFKHRFEAESGEHGRGKNQSGKSGKDLTLRVPCGTIIRTEGRKKAAADLVNDGDEVVIAKGGSGGLGNSNFATSTNQAPRHATPGTEGEEKDIVLELRLLADVGLVGFPNAGKSTLISTISAARPKIADYPFTTLVPNLGMVRYQEGKSFVVADIPGLIEGAHQGKGLGIQFLRHIERTRVLVVLLEATSADPQADLATLLNELASYSASLGRKRKIIAVTKMDLIPPDEQARFKKLKFGRGVKVVPISAVARQGLSELLDAIWGLISRR